MKGHILIRTFLLSDPFSISFEPLNGLGDDVTRFAFKNITFDKTLKIVEQIIHKLNEICYAKNVKRCHK